MGNERLTGQAILDAGLTEWRALDRVLATRYRTTDYAAVLALVTAIASAADEADHHPDLDLRYDYVDIRLMSHDVFGLTSRDVELARRITDIAADHGATADPSTAQLVTLGIDTADSSAIAPFWQAVLDLREHPDNPDVLPSRDGQVPDVWFQASEPRTERSRIHVDVYVPHDEAMRRVDAALEAGGRLVTDTHAPAWWVLADADGNEACVCTWQDDPSGD